MSTRLTNVFFALATSLLLIGGLAACDSGTDDGNGVSTLSISGGVTDDAGFAKTLDNIEGATVTASELQANGSLSALGGEATTDASGKYTLAVETSTSPLILRAAKSDTDFESKVIVEYESGGASSSVSAMPMNLETRAEADVLVEARSAAGAEAVTAADVALFVNTDIAAAIDAGSATAADVAAVITRGKEAERAHAEEDPEGFSDDQPRRRAEDHRRDSFLELQSQLSAATTASAQAAAREAFERAYVNAFAEAEVNAEVQARAGHSRKSAMLEAAVDAGVSTDTQFELRKRADASLALATSAAIEALFEANSVGQAQIDAVVASGETLFDAVASAGTEAEINAAFGSFSADVEAALSVALDVSPTLITAARAATDAAKVTLETAINAAADAADIASAYVTFFGAAETSATASFAGSANAAMGGEVLALIALY